MYLVREYVKRETLQAHGRETEDDSVWEGLLDEVVDAVRLLLSIPVNSNVPPRPESGGLIKHVLFKDEEAPIEYASVEYIARHLNKVRHTRDD